MIPIRIKKEKGFTLLFAVLLAVLVLAVGASVINIAMKQVILTGIGRESQFAFYAANTGVECALYWDYMDLGVFATSSASVETENIIKDIVNCASGYNLFFQGSPNMEIVDEGVDYATSMFKIEFETPIQYCAIITVNKKKNSQDAIETRIESRGYNTCDGSNPRRIERGLQLSY